LLCTVRHIVVSHTENRIELTCAVLDRVVTGTVKSGNVGNGVWFGNGTSIHIIPTGYLIN